MTLLLLRLHNTQCFVYKLSVCTRRLLIIIIIASTYKRNSGILCNNCCCCCCCCWTWSMWICARIWFPYISLRNPRMHKCLHEDQPIFISYVSSPCFTHVWQWYPARFHFLNISKFSIWLRIDFPFSLERCQSCWDSTAHLSST